MPAQANRKAITKVAVRITSGYIADTQYFRDDYTDDCATTSSGTGEVKKSSLIALRVLSSVDLCFQASTVNLMAVESLRNNAGRRHD